ncbi:hypothetical protein DVH24_003414 [Malus domestica]|uniref:Uncharacterized protein n=1 Tax=Malus domestica TaxID=3750 RepID=A0A498IHQ9_MALDO|nr:hypothetical protein DVH24_003414 [Malus domestica]
MHTGNQAISDENIQDFCIYIIQNYNSTINAICFKIIFQLGKTIEEEDGIKFIFQLGDKDWSLGLVFIVVGMMWLLGGGHQHRVGDLGGGSRGRSDVGVGDALVGDCLVASVYKDGDGEGREKADVVVLKRHFLNKGERKKRLVGPKPQYVSSHYGWNSRLANEPRPWKNFSNIIVWNINNIALFRKSIILLQI